MDDVLHIDKRDGVAVLSVENPPVNALTLRVRARLLEAVAAAEEDRDVGAIVIQARGRTFPAGADVRDLRRHADEPSLRALCARIDACTKPVIAAIHGTALGSGMELALACHFRIAQVSAQLGLPDVALGVVPCAGGSQRLPRIVGAALALEMIVSGRPVSAETAARIGLIDKVVGKNLEKAAFGSARNFAQSQTPPRPTSARSEGMADPEAYLEAVNTRREALKSDRRAAVHRAVDLVEAALLLPVDAGMAMEAAAFEDLVEGDQARGLRHAFLAERRTARVPAFQGIAARKVAQVGLLGSGRLAAELARAVLAAGLPVQLCEPDAEAREAVSALIARGIARDETRGRLDAAESEAQVARLTVTADLADLAAADLVFEATEADAAAAGEALAAAAAATPAGTVLATATSRADLAGLAAASGRAQDVLAFRFFAPAHRVRVVELSAADGAAPDLLATGARLARAMGKVAVVSGPQPGRIGATMLAGLWRAASDLVFLGARPEEVDAAMRDYGFPLGPFELADLVGLERIGRAVGEDLLCSRLLAMGWTGRAARQGIYRYEAGQKGGRMSPEVTALIDAIRRDEGRSPRPVARAEIQERCVLALANAGTGLVARREVYRPSDIDVVMVLGFGFPRWHGGPMEAADQMGLLQLRNRLAAWAEDDLAEASLWAPDPLLDWLIKNGRHFRDLNAADPAR